MVWGRRDGDIAWVEYIYGREVTVYNVHSDASRDFNHEMVIEAKYGD